MLLGRCAALMIWRVRQLAARQGMAMEVPAVRNPFTEEPPVVLQNIIYGAIATIDVCRCFS